MGGPERQMRPLRTGIEGAVFVLFRPGTNATYPVAVAAEGYRRIVASIEFTPGDPDVINLRPVQLQRP